MKTCPNCGEEISKISKFCPECGSELTENSDNMKNIPIQQENKLINNNIDKLVDGANSAINQVVNQVKIEKKLY